MRTEACTESSRLLVPLEMIDPGTALITASGLVAGKSQIDKILGPTSEYLGEQLRGLVEKANINLDRIFWRTYEKLVEKDMLDVPGQVHPRVLKEILAEGAFIEDALSTEYYAGILAASKSNQDGYDDVGAIHLKTVSDLSIHQLTVHYLVHYFRNQLHDPSERRLPVEYRFDHRSAEYVAANFEPHTIDELVYLPRGLFGKLNSQLLHALEGLMAKRLIGGYQFVTGAEIVQNGTLQFTASRSPSMGVLVIVRLRGLELFDWSNGSRKNVTGYIENVPDVLGLSSENWLIPVSQLGHNFSIEDTRYVWRMAESLAG